MDRIFCVPVERLCRLTVVSATECFSDTVANDAYDDLDRRLSVFKFLRRKPSKLLLSISPLPNTLSLYIGAVLARPPQNKLICFSDAVLLFQCCGVETKYVIYDE